MSSSTKYNKWNCGKRRN